MIEWIISSSVLILAVLLLRLLLGRYIGNRLQYSLWVLVLLRLLIPFSVMESPAGAGQMVSGLTEQPVIQVAVGNLDPQQRYDAAVSEVLAAHDFAVEDYAALPEEQQNSITHTYRQEIQQKVESFDTAYSAAQVLRAVWLVGVVIMGLWLLTANVRFGGKLRRSRKKYSGSFSVPVYTAAVETPCLFGLFRPAIYLPECIGDEKTVAHILTHEQTHYRHWDHIWAAARCLCLALHWYNPLVWVAVKVSRTDSELACDEGALAVLGEEQRSDYGRTLIEMSRGKPSAGELLLTATTMTGDKKTLLRRVQSIAKKPKILAIAVVIISVLAAAILLWAFTGAEKETGTPVTRFSELNFNNQYYMFPEDYWISDDNVFCLQPGLYSKRVSWNAEEFNKILFEESDFINESTEYTLIDGIFISDSWLYFVLCTDQENFLCRYELSEDECTVVSEVPSLYRWAIMDDYFIYRERKSNNDEMYTSLCIYNMEDGITTEICSNVEEFGIIDGQLRYLTYSDVYTLYQYDYSNRISTILGQFHYELGDKYRIFNFTTNTVVMLSKEKEYLQNFAVYNVSTGATAVYALPKGIQQLVAYDSYAYATAFDMSTYNPSSIYAGKLDIYRINLGDGSYKVIENGLDSQSIIHVVSDDCLYILQSRSITLFEPSFYVYRWDYATGRKEKLAIH